MGAALFMDESSAFVSDRSSFHIRNFNFSNLDAIYADLDPNLTTGTREGMNFVRVVKDVLAGGEDGDDGNAEGGGGVEPDANDANDANDAGDDAEDPNENANDEEDAGDAQNEQSILSG